MNEFSLVCRNRYLVKDFVILKYKGIWRVSKEVARRRGCLTRPQDVLYQAKEFDAAFIWCQQN